MGLLRYFLLVFVSLTFTSIYSVEAITFKLASPAPEASVYGEAVSRIAARWSEASDGEVKIRVFHGGIAGDGSTALRRMRIGQIHMAIISGASIAKLSKKAITVNTPGLIRSDEEMEYLFPLIESDLNEEANAAAIEVIGWARPGWVSIFSNEPVRTPSDLADLTLSLDPGAEESILALRQMGFRVAPSDVTDWLTGINSGRIQAVFSDPIFIGGLQLFTSVNYMLDLLITPYLAALVISDSAWRRVPEDLRPALSAIVEEEIAILEREGRASLSNVIELMEEFGLTIISPTAEEVQEWHDIFAKSSRDDFTGVYDADFHRKIESLLMEFRSQQTQ